jgi:acylphosphatase
MSKSAHVSVTGRVQGVGYRAWTEEQARRRGLSGWVRNRRDGSVEAVVAGDEAAVEEMLAYFWQGPLSARIERVEIADAQEPMTLGFRVLPTA